MCTLIFLFQLLVTHPVVVLMNRDELYGRPSAPPSILAGSPPIVAPQDLRAGGTWIGVNANGFFVALSNRHLGSEDSMRRSRGLLVMDLLTSRQPSEAIGVLTTELRSREYNPFNLVMGDGGSAYYVSWDGPGNAPHVEALARGVHVLGNRNLNDPADPRVARALALVGSPPPRELGAAEAVLLAAAGDHGGGSGALCRHGEVAGTVSSIFFALEPRLGGGSRLLFAPGPPGENPFRDDSRLLTEVKSATKASGRRRRSRP